MSQPIEHYRNEARQGRLAYQECRDCNHRIAFVRPFCDHCGGNNLDWKHADGNGHVIAQTVMHRAPTSEYRERVPYIIVLVDLTEGIRVMGHAAPSVTIGDTVGFEFRQSGDRDLLY